MTPLSSIGTFGEKRPKPTTLLYLILITVLLIMISVVVLAIFAILGRAERLPNTYSNSQLQSLLENASTLSSTNDIEMDNESERLLLINAVSEKPEMQMKSIAEDYSTSQTSAHTGGREMSTKESMESTTTLDMITKEYPLSITKQTILTQQPNTSGLSSPTSTPTSVATSFSVPTSASTLSPILTSISSSTSSFTSTFTSTTTSISLPTKTQISSNVNTTSKSTTSGQRVRALGMGKNFGSRQAGHLSNEPINAIEIDFENAIHEFDNLNAQQLPNTTAPEESLPQGELPVVTESTTGTTPSMSSSGSSSNSISRISDKLLENMVPQCVKKKSQKCRRPALQRNVISRDEIPLENTAAELGHFGGFRAVHYRLNITINRDMHTSYEGSVEIMLRAVENTSTVFVHVGRPIAGIDLAQIELWNCFNGNILCVSSMVQHLHHELLSIDLTESILIGQLIVLRVSNFGSPHADNGFVVQNPHKWEPKRPWTVTTLFQMRDARSIMPCIDLPSMKATLDLCVTHPAGTEARSNSPLQKSAVDGKVTTCFARTSPMSTYLYAIAVFNRMQSMYQSADHKLHLPELEVLYPEQMSAEKPVWIKAETIQALRFMSNFTGFDYPLKKLSLIITSLPLNGVENFGLINLNERWMAYPKYRMAHSILVNEIAHQWIGNLVTVKKWNEICLQEGLTTYLEWLLTAELDKTMSVFDAVHEKRIEAIARETKNNAAIISDFRTHEDIFRCFDKPAIFFVMLESGFGVGVVSKLAHLLIEKYAYNNAGVHEWYEVITEATNNELAGQFFMDYFTQPGFPLVRVAHTPNGVILKQETMIAAKKANTSALVVPLELSTDGSNARQRILLNESEQTFPLKHHGIVVVDPDRKAYAVIVYEPEIYIRLLQCAQTDSCTHVNATNMRHIAEDFCWAFLNDHLAARDSRRESIRVWAEFTRLLSALNYVRGSCACCMDKNLSKTFNVPCKWHWKDRCEQIQLVKQIHSTSK